MFSGGNLGNHAAGVTGGRAECWELDLAGFGALQVLCSVALTPDSQASLTGRSCQL